MRSPSKPGPVVDDPTEITVPPVAPRASEEITASTTPAPAPAPLPARVQGDIPPGTRLGEYTVDGKLGEGGMSSVFSARHPLIGKRAAIKVLSKQLCEDPVTLARFLDEARIVNEIGHPNIVDIFAFGTLPDGRSYFVMEWLRGESLRARLARGSLDHVEACAILKQLARALRAVHDKGVVHRDLKPDNVFLVDEGEDVPRVKLLDFGIAKLVRADQQVSRTATGAMIGTPQYVAPEQAKGRPIDAAADIYSLGCVAFELLAGRPPFIADNAMEMVAKHLMEAPPRVSSFVSSVPAGLDQLVFDMLAKERERRPSMATIVAAVERALRTTAGPSAVPASAVAPDAVASTSVANVIAHDATADTVAAEPIAADAVAAEPVAAEPVAAEPAAAEPVIADEVAADVPAATAVAPDISAAYLEATSDAVPPLRRRPAWLAPLGLVMIGVVAAAVAFMIVSALKAGDESPEQGSHVVAPAPPAPSTPVQQPPAPSPSPQPAPSPEPSVDQPLSPPEAAPPLPSPVAHPHSTPSPRSSHERVPAAALPHTRPPAGSATQTPKLMQPGVDI